MSPCAKPTRNALPAKSARFSGPTGAQPKGTVSRPTSVTTEVDISRIASVDSPPVPILRVTISRNAPINAASSGTIAARRMSSGVGRIINTTPVKPIATANHRRHPTGSRNNSAASAVARIGPANVIAMASASGIRVSAVTNRNVDKDMSPPRVS